MRKLRIIKRKDGIIQTQHRVDERYDDSTLPRGTKPTDVSQQVIVDAAQLADIEDVQAQVDLVDGKLVKDQTRKPIAQQLADQRASAEAILKELEGDRTIPEGVKRYLIALRDLNAGSSRIAHSTAPAAPRRK